MKVLALFGTLIAITGIAFYAVKDEPPLTLTTKQVESRAPEPPPPPPPPPPPTPDDLELLEQKSSGDIHGNYITGRIKNNSGKTYSYAQVTFGIYNDKKERISTAMDNTSHLAPGEVWKFKAHILVSGSNLYKLIEIKGY